MELRDIDRLSFLSRISLSDEEKKSFLKDFESILGYVGELQKVAADMPAPAAGELRNVMRDDALQTPPLSTPESLLAEAPSREENYVKVDQVL